jgi:hypothetical protein
MGVPTEKTEVELMTDKTQILVIERDMDVIIKENEGQNKKGKPKQTRISTFGKPENAMRYLRQKFGIGVKSEES